MWTKLGLSVRAWLTDKRAEICQDRRGILPLHTGRVEKRDEKTPTHRGRWDKDTQDYDTIPLQNGLCLMGRTKREAFGGNLKGLLAVDVAPSGNWPRRRLTSRLSNPSSNMLFHSVSQVRCVLDDPSPDSSLGRTKTTILHMDDRFSFFSRKPRPMLRKNPAVECTAVQTSRQAFSPGGSLSHFRNYLLDARAVARACAGLEDEKWQWRERWQISRGKLW